MAKETPNNTEKSNAIKRLVRILFLALKSKERAESNVRNEYRYNLDAQHPNYVFEVNIQDDEWKAIGITHEAETFGKPNMPLKQNPKKTDDRPSYVRNGIVEDGHKNFSRKKMKNVRFSKEDMPNVKAKIRNFKNERRKKKHKKRK